MNVELQSFEQHVCLLCGRSAEGVRRACASVCWCLRACVRVSEMVGGGGGGGTVA